MNASQRATLFLFGCISSRLVIALIAYKLSQHSIHDLQRKLLACISIIIGISFITLYAANLRQNAPEAGGVTWWNTLRPLHGALWLFAGSALLCPRKEIQNLAWIVFVIDAMIGLGAWVKHRYIK